eukprot:407301-Rhodomonas_salina.2
MSKRGRCRDRTRTHQASRHCSMPASSIPTVRTIHIHDHVRVMMVEMILATRDHHEPENLFGARGARPVTYPSDVKPHLLSLREHMVRLLHVRL